MSHSNLEARLLEPALCHSFPDKPTCLAYDAKNEHIAVGFHNGKVSILCKNGNRQVKVLSHDDHNGPDGSEQVENDDFSKPVKLMSFCYYEVTTNKTFLVTTLKGISRIFLWSFTEESKCVSTFIGDKVTVLTWSPTSLILYAGTNDGDVVVLKVSDSTTLALEQDTDPFASTRIYGEVVAVTESPLKDLILVVFSSGVCMMKNKASKELTFPVHDIKMEPVAAWWSRNRDKYLFEVIDRNGTYATIGYKTTSGKHKFVELERQKENGCVAPKNVCNTMSFVARYSTSKGGAAITKAQYIFVPDKGSLIAYTGDSPVLLEGFDKSHVITMVHDSGYVNIYPLTPFDDRVVDFVFYEKFNKNLLIVLTEADILLLTTTKVDKIADNVTVLRYNRYDQFSAGYPYITSPVTCLHHCGECSKKFLSSFEEQSRATPELVVTGHSDGSVRLWLCYYIDGSPSFNLLKKTVDTESYFEEQQKISSAVSSVKVIDSQYLLVIKESGRVLLFSLWKISDSKPHSQEIFLREGYDGPSNSPEILKTPPPHFCPRQQLKHIQLLQHFSCFYQSGRSKHATGTDGQTCALVPVTVNCVDYNEQMGMLAVGTEKCLVVIDTKKNMLVQVIRSENKLLKLCLDLDKHKQKCSVKKCDVVCLETAMINWKDEEEAQHTLWVGTRGGSLGALNIIRERGQVLELKETGLGRHCKESIKGFHFHQNMKKLEKHVTVTDFSSDGVIDFYITNVVVTTEKYFQIFRIPGLKEKYLGHGGMMWSGLIEYQGKPFIVYVTKDGCKLAGYNLTDFNHISKSLPAHCHPVEQDLFSSNGKHAAMKCSDQFYYIMDSA